MIKAIDVFVLSSQLVDMVWTEGHALKLHASVSRLDLQASRLALILMYTASTCFVDGKCTVFIHQLE